MNGFTYTLILEEPVLANSLAGDTNSARSLPYIPGGLVRGALVQLYGGEKKVSNPDFKRLFLKGAARFLHAYPVCSEKRTLPTPLAWKTYKDDESTGVENFAHSIKSNPKLKNASFGFYTLKDGTVYKVKHEWQVNIHTQRDAVLGRANTGKGAVYRYEALPAGLHLKGAVLTDTKEDAETLRKLLEPGSILLGKARTAGYGRARIITGDLDAAWREDDTFPLPAGSVKEFTLTFLSDALLRDDNGQNTMDPLPALKKLLQVKDLKVKSAFHKKEVVGGFNRQWGLPLPQGQALGAGSLLVLSTDTGIQGDLLANLEASGMGERVVEGFGRVSVSGMPVERFDLKVGELKIEAPSVHALLPNEQPVADLMLKRLLRRNLDEKMMSTVIEAVKVYNGGVKNSQLSRWRVNLRSAIGAEKGMELIHEFYKKEAERNSPSWQKMMRARVSIREKDKDALVYKSKRLTEWMESLIQKKASLWEMFGYLEEQPVMSIGTQNIDGRKEFESEYSLRLMDAVLASLAKKNVEGGKNDN